MRNFDLSGNRLVNGNETEQVSEYKYLGHEVRIGRYQTCEIERRMATCWMTLGTHSSILKGDLPMLQKRKIFEQYITLVIT